MKLWTPNPVQAAQLEAWAATRQHTPHTNIFTELYAELVQNRPVPADSPVSPPTGTGRTFADALALAVSR